MFAEWLVLKLLDVYGTRRVSWANSDLITPDGVRIEVKSTAYWQSWKLVDKSGSALSAPSRPIVDDKQIAFHGLRARDSEAISQPGSARTLKLEKNPFLWNAMDLSQWEFYVIRASELKFGSVFLTVLRSKFRKVDAASFSQEAKRVIEIFRKEKQSDAQERSSPPNDS